MAASANTARPVPGNGDFADRAPPAAKRDSRAPDSIGLALVAYAALIVVTSLSGAFGTHQLHAGPRFAFWTALILWNAMKWHGWFALVRTRLGWPLAIVLGGLLLNLPLPFETRLALGQRPTVSWDDFAATYVSAVAISWVSGAALTLAIRHFVSAGRSADAPQDVAPASLEAHTGIWSLGFAADALWAIEAEDHYVRLLLADGRAPLFTARFGDALAQVAHLKGCRIHRGRWIADAAVTRIEREGRGWRAVLPDGRRLAISASHVGSVRERGWTGRRA
jgi:hypothetical protein